MPFSPMLCYQLLRFFFATNKNGIEENLPWNYESRGHERIVYFRSDLQMWLVLVHSIHIWILVDGMVFVSQDSVSFRKLWLWLQAGPTTPSSISEYFLYANFGISGGSVVVLCLLFATPFSMDEEQNSHQIYLLGFLTYLIRFLLHCTTSKVPRPTRVLENHQ